MVKRCAYAKCNSDTRYPDRVAGVNFIPFMKPSIDLQRCLLWIKACNRPHKQLNKQKITKDTYICSKHFENGNGPSDEYPDPIPHGGLAKQARAPRRRRRTLNKQPAPTKMAKLSTESGDSEDTLSCSSSEPTWQPNEPSDSDDLPSEETPTKTNGKTTLHHLADIALLDHQKAVTEQLKQRIKELERENSTLRHKKMSVSYTIEHRHVETTVEQGQPNSGKKTGPVLNAHNVMKSKIPGVFKTYTGLEPQAFENLFSYLVPNANEIPLKYSSNRKEIGTISLKDQLFFTLCKLRQGTNDSILAFSLGTTQQAWGIIFKSWVNYMYLSLGQLCIWPSRETVVKNMPEKFKEEYPNTIAIIDCTEIKTEKPSSLKAQSMMYSDYKSTTTLKSLIACDPRGTLLFVSELFSGSISDNAIVSESGFLNLLKDLIESQKLHRDDAIMADKGFRIEKGLADIGLKLNIPPFAHANAQMEAKDVAETVKIAKHRIHVERIICRLKDFKILTNRVPVRLFNSINQIFSVCSLLTLWQNPIIKKK